MVNPNYISPAGAAGLSFGTFGTTVTIINLISSAFKTWKDLQNLNGDLRTIQALLLLQMGRFDQWNRDWYIEAPKRRASAMRLRQLSAKDEAVRTAVQVIEEKLKDLDPMQMHVKAQSHLGVLQRGKLISGQVEAAYSTVDQLTKLVDGLYSILPPISPNTDAAPTFVLLNRLDDVAGENVVDPRVNLKLEELPLAIRTYKLKELEQSLATGLKARVDNMKRILPSPKQKFNASLVKKGNSDPLSAGGRSFGTYQSDSVNSIPVIIEWKRYNAAMTGKHAIEISGRIDDLSRFLHENEKPEQLMTLKCLGYFDDVDHNEPGSRYGFVFEYPNESRGNMISLRSILGETKPELRPSLEERYQIAYSLTFSLTILHTASWLHKSIRSQNILIPFPGGSIGRPLWTTPYLVGFEYSRQDVKDAVSEPVGYSERFNLYRHPQAQGTPSEGFRKAFDIYSLGVILAEIGLWISAWNLQEKNGYSVFRDGLTKTVHEEMAFHMGEEYCDATLACIQGDWDNSAEPVVEKFFIEVVEVLGRCASGIL